MLIIKSTGNYSSTEWFHEVLGAWINVKFGVEQDRFIKNAFPSINRSYPKYAPVKDATWQDFVMKSISQITIS